MSTRVANQAQRPTVPREHGAWVMLTVPLLVGLASGRPGFIPALLLLVAASCLFCGQEGWRPPWRLRSLWPAAVALAAVTLLVRGYGLWSVLDAGVVAALLALVWLALPTRRLARRQTAGQLLAVAVLTLGAPAGYAVAHGAVSATAWLGWLACFAWFAGGVLYVQMLLAAPKSEAGLPAATRWRAGGWCLGYHAALGVACVALLSGGAAGLLLAVGLAPAPLRAAWRYPRLGPKLVLKQVGLWEAAYSVWFAAFAITALRLLS